MAELTREQVVDYLSNMSVMDIAGLVEELEEKWGVTAAAAAAPVMVAGPAGGGEAAAEEKKNNSSELYIFLGCELFSSLR